MELFGEYARSVSSRSANRLFRISVVAAALALLAPSPRLFAAIELANHHEVKYVILMVPDGMNLSSVTAARIKLNGIAGVPLYLETLDRVGYQRTYSEKNTVTDSSAAASAWACGEKFINNEVCLHIDGRPNNLSLLELARDRGMSTGLVATQTITHATPASFGAHVRPPAGSTYISPRDCQSEIARQYVEVTQPDVLLGGGRLKFAPTIPDKCGAGENYIEKAMQVGYTYISDPAMLGTTVEAVPKRLLGLFGDDILKETGLTDPFLPKMTAAALSLLERNKTGFFLMVEGSLIDDANHKQNLDYLVREMNGFDKSVKAVLDWIAAKPDRKEHTFLMVLPDHETGALAIHATERPADPAQPLGYFWNAYSWQVPPEPETHHAGGDIVFWAQGPGSEALSRTIDNTDVYHVVKELLRY